jgi:hypothetical protein
MCVSVVSVDSALDRVSFPGLNSDLLYVEDGVDVSWAEARARASSNVVKAVFFTYANMHEILADSGFDIRKR